MKLIALAVFSMVATAPADAKPKSGGYASIPFVNHGGIQDWRSTDDHTLYVQSQGGRWYVAKTMGPCQGLNTAIRVGFDAGPTDTFDNFSNIVVEGQRCPIKSLTRIDGPPPSSKAHKMKHKA